MCGGPDIVVRIGQKLNQALEKGGQMGYEFEIGDGVKDGNPIDEEHPGEWVEGVNPFCEERDEARERKGRFAFIVVDAIGVCG